MARALARGWGDPVLCSDGGSGRARALADELGGEAVASNLEVADRADLVVLCHKPAQFEPRCRTSCGGTPRRWRRCSAASIRRACGPAYGVPVFRFMPNTPVEVRRGVVCYSPEPEVDPQLEPQVLELFGRLGSVVQVPESLIDAASAVMGVGSRLPGAARRGAGRRRRPPRPEAGAGRPARGRDDGRYGGAAPRARLRHARGPARGDLAGRHDRARAGRARARRGAARPSRMRSTRWWGRRGDGARGSHPWRHRQLRQRAVPRLHPADLRLHPAQHDVLVRRCGRRTRAGPMRS